MRTASLLALLLLGGCNLFDDSTGMSSSFMSSSMSAQDAELAELAALLSRINAAQDSVRPLNQYRRIYARMLARTDSAIAILQGIREATADTQPDTIFGDTSTVPIPVPVPIPDETGYADTLAAGESIQAAVNAHPAGAVFLLRSGTYRGQQVSPKEGNSFIGESGTVLDGGGSTRHAFVGTVNNVTIQGLTIQNYANPVQTGAIQPETGGWPNVTQGVGWVVEGNTITENLGYGIRMGRNMTVRNNRIIRNKQLGIGGHGSGSLVEGNEIAYNNYANAHNWGWEAGGSKWSNTTNLIVRNNFVHHNVGPGLWTDINNDEITIEGNRVEDNVGPGIFHEISYRAVIRNNQVRRNASQITNPYPGGAGIVISASGCPGTPSPVPVCVEVSGNIVESLTGGIVAIQQARGSGSQGEYRVEGLWVHDNQVTFAQNSTYGSGWNGILRDDGRNEIFDAARNNRFDRNNYRTNTSLPRFHLAGHTSWSQWRAAGMDVGGSIAP